MDSFKSERTIIGILLNTTDKIDAVLDRIGVADFENKKLGQVFATIVSMVRAKVDVTPFSIAAVMGHGDKKLAAYLDELFEQCCSTQNIIAWSDIVREMSVQRQLKSEITDDGPCCVVSKSQSNVAEFFRELSNELIHKLPREKEEEYLENVMVSCNRALSHLMQEITA